MKGISSSSTYSQNNVISIDIENNLMFMHIVYICREYIPTRRGGGIASYLKEVAEYLVTLGHEVTVIAASDDTREEKIEILNGVRVFRLSGGDFVIPSVEKTFLYRRFRTNYRYESYRRRIFECLKKLDNVDVIEVADYGAESLYVDIDVPITMRLHTSSLFDLTTQSLRKRTLRNFWFYKKMLKELDLIRTSQYITSCSESMQNWVVDNLGVDPKNITVIRNPVNKNKLLSVEEENILSKGELNLVYVGTICETKGCGELVEAAKMIKTKYPNLHLWLFGKEGKWGAKLKEQNSHFDWIHVYGKIDRNLLFPIYRNADLICLPSWWDNMPMTCIEGMMSGGLVLGSNSGGMAEVITEGINGFLVHPKDSMALAQAIANILSLNEKKKLEIRKAAKEEAVSSYSTEVIVGKLLSYYQWVIDDYRMSHS